VVLNFFSVKSDITETLINMPTFYAYLIGFFWQVTLTEALDYFFLGSDVI